jgi:hypothetical protein
VTPQRAPVQSDLEFVAALRLAVERYLAAVDRWEAAYQKYYRLPGYSRDLEDEEREYRERRRELEAVLPIARRLCLKYDLPHPFAPLVYVTLGAFAPQERTASAIGRSERNAVTKVLLDLEVGCRGWAEPRESERPSLLHRIVGYFRETS